VQGDSFLSLPNIFLASDSEDGRCFCCPSFAIDIFFAVVGPFEYDSLLSSIHLTSVLVADFVLREV